jgi:nuclease HARBI1
MNDDDLLKYNPSTISRSIQTTVKQIANMGNAGIIKMPTSAEDIQEVKQKFMDIAQFPDVIGALGCSQVRIRPPEKDIDKAFCKNESGHYSIKVQFVSDADLRIREITARWGGAAPEQIIFEKSYLKVRNLLGNLFLMNLQFYF